MAEIATVAKPDTILAWHRTGAGSAIQIVPDPSKSVGRPRIEKEIEKPSVVRMARENRSWGYDRIVGALTNLGYRLSDQTVGNILKRHSIPPAPERKTTVTWQEFIPPHQKIPSHGHYPLNLGKKATVVEYQITARDGRQAEDKIWLLCNSP